MKSEITLRDLQIIKQALADGTNRPVAVALVDRLIHQTEVISNHDKSTWKTWAPRYGLKAEQFGKKFIFRGRQYEITGFNPGAPTYPVQAKRLPDGRPFRFPVHLASLAA